PAYALNVCTDANGVPGAVLNSTPFQPRVPGSSGWQQINLTNPVGGLVPGSVCHLVIAPTGTPSPTEYIELVVTRAGYPSRYVPTDGTGTSFDSPCDRYLSIMLSDSANGPTPGSDFFLVEAESNRGFTPIF